MKDPNLHTAYQPIQVEATTMSSFVPTRSGSHAPTHTPHTSSFHEQLFNLLAKIKEPLGGQAPGGNTAPVAFVVPDLSWKGSRAEVAVSSQLEAGKRAAQLPWPGRQGEGAREYPRAWLRALRVLSGSGQLNPSFP